MPLLSWKENMSVNNREIDSQHKKLISLTNELSDAMKERKGKEILNKTICELVSYTEVHFKYEEDYFDKYVYKETISHKDEHKKFVKQISEFKNDFESGKLSLSIDVMSFLSSWLRNHIKGTDQKYTQFFKDNNIN
ncbi:MAG: hemerythrin [Gammaproteobacteria bacterium]|nr:MAG: hemerythrin [Gammaproteobacteria bacterium]